MKQIIKENIVKNIILIILLVGLFFMITKGVMESNLPNNRDAAENLLLATSLISVIACFGNFSFTYEEVHKKSTAERYLAHLTTGLLMLVIGTSLIFTSRLIFSTSNSQI